MKKVFCLLSLALLCPAAANAAEDAGDFYQNLLVTDEVIAAENEDIATTSFSIQTERNGR